MARKARLIVYGLPLLGLLTLLLGGCATRPGTNEGPVAIISYSLIEGAPKWTYLFDASLSYTSSGEILRYYWDFGDGTTDEGVQVQHLYTKLGRYYVVLTVVDTEGRSAWDGLWVDVTGTPPIAIIEAPTEVASWQMVTFDGTASYDPDGLILSYRWDFGDGETAEGPVVQHLYRFMDCKEPPVTYTVTLEVTDDDGLRARAIHVITVYPVCVNP